MSALAVAAPSAAAADAAHQVAVAGGNAVDAALAAALVAMVNEVGIVSLSSGAFVTVQPAGPGTAYTVDGWMDMPGRGRDPGRDRDGDRQSSTWDVATEYGGGVDITIGPGSVAVHGALAAFGEAHRRDGRLPWADVVAPALEVARRGFQLTPASRYYLDFVHDDIFGWDPASRAALHDTDGRLTTEPILLRDLAASLETIGYDGPDALHRGVLAERIAADVLDRGGILGLDDLTAYRPVVRPALVTRVGGWSLATTPPPSMGGVCLTAMLRLMDGRPHGAWEDSDVEHLVRVQRAVLGHRHGVLEHATDLEATAADYLALVDRDHVAVLESGSTAHVSATDRSGEACSVTFSSGYGSGMIAAGTGIWLNNCLGEQELNPLGLYGSAAGTRLLSNMAPTVARHDDGSTLAIGSPGADRITTAIAQVLAGFLSGLPLQEAVDHPRVHVHRAGRPDEVVRRESEPTMYFGGIGATLCDADGRLTAAADPRRDGAVRLVER
jgi:gamma-glutamyltranspeptidase/glutathione hydrolase